MKKNIGLILLIIVMALISILIVFTIVSKQKMSNKKFNIKNGDVLEFKEYETKVTVLHVASTLCNDKENCIEDGEIEASLRVDFNNETTNYTLKSKSNPQERIKNSNNYLILSYKDEKIIIEVKNKTEM